jgi:hypothetical protein
VKSRASDGKPHRRRIVGHATVTTVTTPEKCIQLVDNIETPEGQPAVSFSIH